ncbi:MAG: hypothetical protein MMC23_000054 [Stictis urceolatum]|nr:hypothetical protein [Stictis urceolata]
MPSHTRSNSSINKPQLSAFQKKQKMSLTQTYYLAHTARAKLSKEAARADHDLRLLVGHANLLDGLMIDLADAEREQESWFNNTVAKASSTASELKHIQWSDSLPAVGEEYDEDSESSDSDSDDEMSYSTSVPLRRIKSPPAQFTISEEAIEDDDEDDEELQLVRTPSRSSPPELLHEHDSESESDDDAAPPSPPQPEIPLDAFSAKQREIAQQSDKNQSIQMHQTSEEAFYEDGFYLPQRQAVAAY